MSAKIRHDIKTQYNIYKTIVNKMLCCRKISIMRTFNKEMNIDWMKNEIKTKVQRVPESLMLNICTCRPKLRS